MRGVVFDLDGTLYDKRPLERYMIRRFWYALPRLVRYRDVRASLAGEEHGSLAGIERAALERLARRPGSRERWRRWIRERYDPAIVDGIHRVGQPHAGARALLQRLRARGLRVGLVSDYIGVDVRLAALGIESSLFDYRLETERAGTMKPGARAVELTLAGMGLDGASMIMVGDRAFADQRFATAAGMEFLGVHSGRGQPRSDSWAPWAQIVARLDARTVTR